MHTTSSHETSGRDVRRIKCDKSSHYTGHGQETAEQLKYIIKSRREMQMWNRSVSKGVIVEHSCEKTLQMASKAVCVVKFLNRSPVKRHEEAKGCCFST